MKVRSVAVFDAAIGAADLTGAQLGRAVGLSRERISQLRHDPKTSITRAKAEAIERALNVPQGSHFEPVPTPAGAPAPSVDIARTSPQLAVEMSGEQVGTRYRIPIAPGTHIVIEGEFPLSSTVWDQLLAVLDVLKPGLVVSSASVGRQERLSTAGPDTRRDVPPDS